MDTIEVAIAGELEHGSPLLLTCGIACIPPEAIEEYEIVYRERRAPDVMPGDLLIVEPRTTAFTGELVVAFQGPNLYLGRWWAKHGLRELRLVPDESVEGEVDVAGVVTVIVRQS